MGSKNRRRASTSLGEQKKSVIGKRNKIKRNRPKVELVWMGFERGWSRKARPFASVPRKKVHELGGARARNMRIRGEHLGAEISTGRRGTGLEY